MIKSKKFSVLTVVAISAVAIVASVQVSQGGPSKVADLKEQLEVNKSQISMSEKCMKGPYIDKGKVIFSYCADKSVNVVALAGIFNSWNSDRNYFAKNSDGVWQVGVELPPGRHAYKLVIDNELWIPDPSNLAITEDLQNNSSFSIGYDGSLSFTDARVSKKQPSPLYQNSSAYPLPQWLDDAVLYHVEVRSFSGNGFKGVEEKLGYLAELGVNALVLMPIFEVGKKNQPKTPGDIYAIKDFYAIDKSLGTEQDLKHLIAAAKNKGFRVLLDIPVNRSSIDNALVTEHPDWFQQNSRGEVIYEIPNRRYFAGFDFDNKYASDYVISVYEYWLKHLGLDGFRVDDADMASEELIKRLSDRLVSINDDIVLLSHSVNEYHSLHGPYLSSDGSVRIAAEKIAKGNMGAAAFRQYQESLKYSFPRGSRRLQWLEEKEQQRWYSSLPVQYHRVAVALNLTMEGVPSIIMGEEFGDRNWNGIESSYSPIQLDWSRRNAPLFDSYKELIALRGKHPALRKGEMEYIDLGHEELIAFYKTFEGYRVLVLVNLSQGNVVLQADKLGITKNRPGLHNLHMEGDRVRVSPLDFGVVFF